VKKLVCLLALIYLASGQASAADEFEKVQCGADIPQAMIGQQGSNERTVVIEKKHDKLGLRLLGADEISDKLSSINWLICGAEYIALVDRRHVVTDALPMPAHSKESPAFSGICQAKGKDLPDIIFAILDGASAKESLPVRTAWKIDQQRARFVKVPSNGLLCPRSGIYTVDGGL